MNKSTIIGFIIILAIVALMPFYQKIVNPKKVIPKTEIVDTTKTADTSKTITSDTVINTPNNITQLKQNDTTKTNTIDTTQIEEKFVYVKNNLYEATLSNKGGDLISFKLLKYKDPQNNPVELINPNYSSSSYYFNAKLNINSINTNNITYAFDKENITLSEIDSSIEINFIGTADNGVGIIRRYVFHYNSYIINHHLVIASTPDNIIKEVTHTLGCGSIPTEKNPNSEIKNIKAGVLYGEEFIRKGLGKKPFSENYEGSTKFCSVQSKYFTIILAPENKIADASFIEGDWETIKIFNIDLKIPHFKTGLKFNHDKEYYESNEILYLGPQDYFGLKKLGNSFDKVVDMGWKWLKPISIAFLYLFVKLHSFISNYGLVIILFTFLIKILFYPLNHKMLHSMKKMKDLEPKLKSIQQSFKDNPQEMNKRVMALYKEEGVSPLSGCLPMLIQMPIFIALFQVFSYTIELRSSPFIFWIKDLSQKDPYMILPIVMGVTQFIQQKMTVKDPKQMMMVYMMPIMFFFLFKGFPSGLVLYWTMFNIFSIIQQYYYEKRYAVQEITTL